MHRKRRSVLVSTLLVVLAVSFARSHQIVSTNDPVKNTTVTNFGCRDKIYIRVDWDPVPEMGTQSLNVTWVNPEGNVERTTNVLVTGAATWAWLELQGGDTGIFKVMSPDRGYDKYIGDWKAEVSLDDKHIGTVQFSVSC
jgi:hypothetical protein